MYIEYSPPPPDARRSSYTVGVGFRSSQAEGPHYEDQLPLLRTDDHLALRLLLDNSAAEAFWQGGRVAMTVDGTADPSTAPLVISASAAATLTEATVYAMSDIHTTVDDVLATPPRVQL